MKKLLAFLMAAVMCLSFAACGEEEAPAEGTTKKNDAPVEEKVPDGIWSTTVKNIDDAGRIELNVTLEELAKANIVPGNEIRFTCGEIVIVGLFHAEPIEAGFQLCNDPAAGVVEFFLAEGPIEGEIVVGSAVTIERVEQPK